VTFNTAIRQLKPEGARKSAYLRQVKWFKDYYYYFYTYKYNNTYNYTLQQGKEREKEEPFRGRGREK